MRNQRLAEGAGDVAETLQLVARHQAFMLPVKRTN